MTRQNEEQVPQTNGCNPGNVLIGIGNAIRWMVIIAIITWHGFHGPILLTFVLTGCFFYLEYKNYQRLPDR